MTCVRKTQKGKCGLSGKECIVENYEKCDNYLSSTDSTPAFDNDRWREETALSSLTRAFGAIFRGEERKFRGSDKADAHHKKRWAMGHYHFIPRDTGNVMNMLVLARKYITNLGKLDRPKFLDCGCGVGNVVILANFVGFNAYGIEYDTVTLARGKRLLKQFGMNPQRLMKGDILKYSKYHEYDMLYGYCPMNNHKFEQQFENKLKLDMKVGALMAGLPFYSGCEMINNQPICCQRLTLSEGNSFNNMALKIGSETS